MTRKPFSAFGRILYANYYDAGDIVEVSTTSDSATVLFASEGSFTARDKQTNEIIHECEPGWYSYGNWQDRVGTCTANTASVWWCYDPLVNQGYVPPIDPLILKKGASASLANGANLFLCAGTVKLNGKTYTGPYQLLVRSGDTKVVATTDIYGLQFK